MRWFFHAFYFNYKNIINTNCRLYDKFFYFIEAEKGNFFFGDDYIGKNI